MRVIDALLAVRHLQHADNRKTAAIRSGPSFSSTIVSANRTYFSDRAAIEAPAENVLESIDTAIGRDGASGKISTSIVFPRSGPADSANRRLAR